MQRIAELLTEANERFSRLIETCKSDNDFSKDFEEVVSDHHNATKYYKEKRKELSRLCAIANKRINQLNHFYNDTDSIKFPNDYARAVKAFKE